MRLQNDGRNIKDNTISSKFALFTDALYHIEEVAWKEIEERNKIKEAVNVAEAMKMEDLIWKEANEAWKEKSKLEALSRMSELDKTPIHVGVKRHRDDDDIEKAKWEREELRNLRNREIERQLRM